MSQALIELLTRKDLWLQLRMANTVSQEHPACSNPSDQLQSPSDLKVMRKVQIMASWSDPLINYSALVNN